MPRWRGAIRPRLAPAVPLAACLPVLRMGLLRDRLQTLADKPPVARPETGSVATSARPTPSAGPAAAPGPATSPGSTAFGTSSTTPEPAPPAPRRGHRQAL